MYPVDRTYKGLTVAGGTGHGFRLEVPPRGRIGKFLVTQVGGDKAGFSYALYNYEAACPPGPNPAATASADADAHLVCAPVAVDAGEATDYEAGFRMLHPYQNLDSGDGLGASDARLYNHGFLYLRVDALGSGDKEFAAAICVYDPSNL